MTTEFEPVAWDVVQRVARPIIARRPSLSPGEMEDLAGSFATATAEASVLVEQETGLQSANGPTRGVVVDAAGWIDVNIRSFRRLMAPVAKRLENSPSARRALNPASRTAAGAELGMMLGWMSGRVLGQYDMELGDFGASANPASDSSGLALDGDVVYFVGENIVRLETENGFESSQFRLWIALHEVTHRLQFTGVPWLRQYFLKLLENALTASPPDLSSLLASLRRVVESIRNGDNPLADGGIVGMIASGSQLENLRGAQALMSLLEGHGDIVMNRAAAGRIPSAGLFASKLAERRKQGGGFAKLVRQAVGLEAKMAQYAAGERFIEEVERHGGTELFSKVWQAEEFLPNLGEIKDPALWIKRVSKLEVGQARANG